MPFEMCEFCRAIIIPALKCRILAPYPFMNASFMLLSREKQTIRIVLDYHWRAFHIPGRKNRVADIEYDTEFYKERNKIERAFGRIKDSAVFMRIRETTGKCGRI